MASGNLGCLSEVERTRETGHSGGLKGDYSDVFERHRGPGPKEAGLEEGV